MIITCDKCSTKFNLDETLIKPTGSKVRCSVCSNQFTAFPPETPEPDERAAAKEKPGQDLDEDSFPGLDETDDLVGDREFSLDEEEEFSFDMEYDDSLDLDFEEPGIQEGEKESEFDLEPDHETLEFDIEDLQVDKEAEFKAQEVEEEEQTEFNFMAVDDESFELEIDSDQDGETKEEETDKSEEIKFEQESSEIFESDEQSELEIGEFDLAETDEMDIEFDGDAGPEASDELEFELDKEEEEELGAGIEFEEEPESEQMAKEEEAEVETEEFDLTLFDESLEDDFDEEEAEEEIGEEGEDEEEGVKERQTETADRPKPEQEKTEKPPVRDFMDQETAGKPAGTSKFFKFILALLVIAIMLVAGYSTCILMGIEVPYISSIKLPFIESVLQKYQSRPEQANIVLDNQSINGRFASNQKEGKLFIITGKAANKSPFPVSHLLVEGTLITKGNVTARTKQVYCGNTVPEDTLKTSEINTIDKLLMKKNGTEGSNKNIRPNGSIPFMIVFSNLPDNLENFSVKPAGHSRPGQKN